VVAEGDADSTSWWLSQQLDRAFAGGRVDKMEEYEEVDVLGHGAFAVVKLLEHRTSERLVVDKQICVVGLSHKDARQLATEVSVQATLRHRYIVRLIGFHESPSALGLLLQYCAGGTLAQFLEKQFEHSRVADVESAQAWMVQLALGLQYVHARGILHRDLSSSNVFLSFEGDALLGDFGLSHRVLGASLRSLPSSLPLPCSARGDAGSIVAAKSQCGTPSYMSPELIDGDDYGAPNDVWALGVIAFEMLALQLPFHAPSLGGLVAAISNGRYHAPALAALQASGSSEELQEAVSASGLLHKDPRRRWTLDELLRRFPPTDEMMEDGE